MTFDDSRKVAEILQAYEGQPEMAAHVVGEVFGSTVTVEIADINGKRIVCVREAVPVTDDK